MPIRSSSRSFAPSCSSAPAGMPASRSTCAVSRATTTVIISSRPSWPTICAGMATVSPDWVHQGLAVGAAVASGLLIGIERGWKLREQEPGSRVAGVRTFSMLGLGSGIAGLIGTFGYPLVAAAIAIGAIAIMVIAYSRELQNQHDSTSAIAAMVTIAIGFLAGSGNPGVAIASASVAVAFLALRTELHGFVERLDEEDVKALARYAIIAGAVLPFLPSGHYGPLGAWNPQKLWLVVVLATRVLPAILILLLPAILVAWGAGYWLYRKAPKADAPAPPGNPIALFPALGFVVFVAIAAVVARWAQGSFGQSGIAVTLLIIGSMDVDVAIVTLGTLAPETITPLLAAMAISGTTIVNMAVKAGITLVYARKKGISAAVAMTASVIVLALMIGLAWTRL